MSQPSLPLTATLQQAVLLLSQARALEQAGQHQQAANAYTQSINLYPQNPAGYAALISMLLEINQIANAEKVLHAVPADVYRQSAKIRSRHFCLLLQQCRFGEALELVDGLLGAPDVDPAMLHNGQAICLNQLGRLEASLPCYRKAHEAGLRDVALFQNWARVQHQLGHVAEAARLYAEAVELYPQDAKLLYEYAIFLLKNEDYARGFSVYRSRWQSGLGEFKLCEAASLGIPAWDGKTPARNLLVGREQGIGDQLVLCALLPAMAAKAGKLTAALDPRLAPLVARSFPGIDVVDHILTPDEARQYDAYLTAADMGMHALEGVGWSQGYLKADSLRAAALREKYRRLFPGKKLVGISWKSKRATLGDHKTVGLQDWRELLLRPECQFISLQYGDIAEDVRAVRESLGVEIHCDPDIDSYNDIDGLAAQIHALDLVITTSNSTAHVAAATNAPTWVLVPMGAGLFWYWGFRNEATWYPHARLFRARKPGEWAPVMERLARAFDEFLAGS